MTVPGRRRPTNVLANAPFRRLWTAMSVCSLGDWLNILALTALAGNLTRGDDYRVQSLAVGGVFIAKMLPAVLLGPLAGAFADRFDRRLTMFVSDLARFAVVLSIPIIGSYQWIIVATLLVECVNLFWVPAKDATVPNLVPKDQLEAANRLNLLVTYGSAPVAALLFAALSVAGDTLRSLVPSLSGLDPTSVALALNALAYLASAFLIFTLRDIPKRDGAISTPSVLKQVVEGWRFVGGDRLVRGLIIGMLGAFAAGGAVVGVAKIYVIALGGGDAAYGVVFGAVFVGMALGMFFGLRLLSELSRRRLFGLAITVAGLVLVAIALIHNLAIVVMLTVVLGACAGIAWIIGYTLIGLEVQDAMRGRTFSFLQSTARVTLLLVVAVANPLAALFGEHRFDAGELSYRFDGSNLVLLLGGALAVVVGFLALRHMDDRKGVPLSDDLIAAVRGERFRTEGGEDMPGLFIAFEGGEGSGKTTQSRMIAIWLRDQGYDVVQTREPGSTKTGMRLRAILLDAAERGLSPRAEALMYAADRSEHVEKVIRPALRRGAIVVCDRYVDSSLAYQGAGRALDSEDVARVNSWATGGLLPDLTVLIDTPPSIGLTRLGGAADRIESEPLEFHERVRKEFRALAAASPERYLVVDGTLTPEEITRAIQDRVHEILPDPVPQEAEDATGTMPAIRD
ncbi:dTMP kinase [Nonomuraea roseoviolacea]|uniref:Thymidylate kinase n=1 Tax=Nonomuraea roseoviolacea subsp. carminata TaxID=160689 RepID=A0ABT1K2A5_9ACTN|nr:dTMP kinase [Nonomuraea roseoviolacea]MCP2347616.1 dTMP kinase [Nonomuraea roseoviolacea subsp. carminata]